MPGIKIYVGKKMTHNVDWDNVTGFGHGGTDPQVAYLEKKSVYPISISLKNGQTIELFESNRAQHDKNVDQLAKGVNLHDVELTFDPSENPHYA